MSLLALGFHSSHGSFLLFGCVRNLAEDLLIAAYSICYTGTRTLFALVRKPLPVFLHIFKSFLRCLKFFLEIIECLFDNAWEFTELLDVLSCIHNCLWLLKNVKVFEFRLGAFVDLFSLFRQFRCHLENAWELLSDGSEDSLKIFAEATKDSLG